MTAHGSGVDHLRLSAHLARDQKPLGLAGCQTRQVASQPRPSGRSSIAEPGTARLNALCSLRDLGEVRDLRALEGRRSQVHGHGASTCDSPAWRSSARRPCTCPWAASPPRSAAQAPWSGASAEDARRRRTRLRIWTPDACTAAMTESTARRRSRWRRFCIGLMPAAVSSASAGSGRAMPLPPARESAVV